MDSHILQLVRDDISACVNHQLKTSAEVKHMVRRFHRYIRKLVFRSDRLQDINSIHSAHRLLLPKVSYAAILKAANHGA